MVLRTVLNVESVTMIMFTMMLKLRNHCHIAGKYIGFGHRYCNINLKLSHKILVVFYNLKNNFRRER